jgi:hypothetical protein
LFTSDFSQDYFGIFVGAQCQRVFQFPSQVRADEKNAAFNQLRFELKAES